MGNPPVIHSRQTEGLCVTAPSRCLSEVHQVFNRARLSLHAVVVLVRLALKTCACHYGALRVETVSFDIPFCRQTQSCLFLFPCAQVFSIVACCVHLLDLRISQSPGDLLKLLCQSPVFVPGSGNFGEHVTGL